MQIVLRLYICVDQAQRFCHTGRGIRFKLVFVHALAAMMFARRSQRICCNPAHKKEFNQSFGTEIVQIK